MNADDTVSDAKNGLFVPQLFAAAGHLHSFPLNITVPSEVDAPFSFLSLQCNHKPLPRFLNEISSFERSVGLIVFSSNIFLRIFFQIFEKTQGKSEKTTTTCVNSTDNKSQKGLQRKFTVCSLYRAVQKN